MSASIRLVNPTEGQLNEAFAIHVTGFKPKPEVQEPGVLWDTAHIAHTLNQLARKRWRFCQSVDAVLPYLDAWVTRDSPLALRRFSIERSGHDYVVDLRGHGPSAAIYHGDSLPRALVICLLRAHGVEVSFT